jgi:sigma-B regulation protein RsbU (phosphoserine phosphatase)
VNEGKEGSMSTGERCVILVDDEQNILNSLKRELREWALERGLEVLTAISAYKGLQILAERGADTVIVVSDLKMPEMKGSEFLTLVREKYPEIMTILLTGYSETEEVIKAVRAGIFSYMLKPWDSDYLVAELQKAFEYGEVKRANARYLKVMEEELKWAGEMQKAILKPVLPRSEGVEFRASYRPVPSLYCGGDYYDVVFLSADRYLLLIGDVAGHGVRAALVTGILKAVIYPEYLRALVGKEFSPGAFLSWLNERMNFELRSASGLIVTFFAGLLDMGARTFRYSNAGQTHPVVLRGGRALELPVSGSGLGFANSIAYAEQSIAVKGGDVITLYTDGLVEPGCADGCAPIKASYLFEKVEYASDYHRKLLETALDESGRAEFDDDVTIVTARIL